MSTDKWCFKQNGKFTLPWDSRLPPRYTFFVRSLLIISSRDCREADSRDTSPRHACLGEVSRKIWLHDFAINNNGGSVPVIFISLADASRHLEYLLARAAILNTNYFRRHTTTRNVTSLGFNARNVTAHNVIMTSAHDVLITSGPNNTCILITSAATRPGKY